MENQIISDYEALKNMFTRASQVFEHGQRPTTRGFFIKLHTKGTYTEVALETLFEFDQLGCLANVHVNEE